MLLFECVGSMSSTDPPNYLSFDDVKPLFSLLLCLPSPYRFYGELTKTVSVSRHPAPWSRTSLFVVCL